MVSLVEITRSNYLTQAFFILGVTWGLIVRIKAILTIKSKNKKSVAFKNFVPMNIWRINLKPDSAEGVDPRQLCFDNGIVGVGWQIEYETEPVLWETYEKIAREKYCINGSRSWSSALNAIYRDIKQDDLIWTRDKQGIYYIGRIKGDWRYETSPDCKKADIVNVRGCEWHKVGTVGDIPGKIVSSFARSRTVQKIRNDSVMRFSKNLYNQITNNISEVEKLTGKDVFSLLSPEDCEDALALYLQVEKGYMVVPSTCKKDTLNYEFELKHRQTGKTAVVQVKNSVWDLSTEEFNKINEECEVFLLTTEGNYTGLNKPNIHFVDREVIKDFLYSNTHLLPKKMKVWIDLTK